MNQWYILSRIGFAIAKRLLEEGARVSICSRKQPNVDRALERMDELGFSDRIMGMKCHVTDEHQRQLFVEKVSDRLKGCYRVIINQTKRRDINFISM